MYLYVTLISFYPFQVLVKRRFKHPKLILNEIKMYTCVMTCRTASGKLYPLYVVCKFGKVLDTWTENGPSGTKCDCSKSGWFDGCTLRNWFFRILLPHARKKIGIEVIISDNLSNLLDPDVIEKCMEHQIKLVFLPPNRYYSSHSAVRCSVFSVLEKNLEKAIRRMEIIKR